VRRFSHERTFQRTISPGWPGGFLVHDRKGENVRTSGLLADNANAGNGDTRFHARFIAPPMMRVKRGDGGRGGKVT
jgi:hypothetical protein